MNTSVQFFPPQGSTVAPQVDWIFGFAMAVSLAGTLLIVVLVLYFIARYLRSPERPHGTYHGENFRLEILWTSFMFVFLMTLFFWGARAYVQAKQPLDNAMVIHVIGKQWMWKIQHPNGAREINEMHVPVGRPIKLVMTSQDVIHDFGLPAFRIKQDVLPGSYTTTWFQATQTGIYHIFCNQYCGTGHPEMIGRVVVMNPADYQAWLAGVTPTESPAAAGARLFSSYGCAVCHGQRAPTLAGLYGTRVALSDGSTAVADESYLRQSILEPAAKIVAGYPPIMPSYKGQLSEEQLIDLIEYIKTLGAVAQPAATSGAPTLPATRPVTGYAPEGVPDYPPARQPPAFEPAKRRGNP